VPYAAPPPVSSRRICSVAGDALSNRHALPLICKHALPLVSCQDHDNANIDGDNPEGYGEREKDRMHHIWRRGALRSLTESARKKGEVRVYKGLTTKMSVTGWPGDLGKHHAMVEELIGLGVLTIHADDDARTYAIVHREKLRHAVDYFAKEAASVTSQVASAAADATGAAASSSVPHDAPYFVEAASFGGARPGYVFKTAKQGLGYYIDGPEPAPPAADTPLPEGWVEGQSPEGYPYFYHVPSATSSWERPSASAPPAASASTVTTTVPLSATVVASLTSAKRAGVLKIESESGAQVPIEDRIAHRISHRMSRP